MSKKENDSDGEVAYCDRLWATHGGQFAILLHIALQSMSKLLSCPTNAVKGLSGHLTE